MTRAHYLRMGSLCGFSKRETLLSAPGEVGDQWELYLKAHGGGRGDPELS